MKISDVNDTFIGAWVEFTHGHGEKEYGRIKSWNDTYVFVVFKCANQWDKYDQYTAQACDPVQLRLLAEHPLIVYKDAHDIAPDEHTFSSLSTSIQNNDRPEWFATQSYKYNCWMWHSAYLRVIENNPTKPYNLDALRQDIADFLHTQEWDAVAFTNVAVLRENGNVGIFFYCSMTNKWYSPWLDQDAHDRCPHDGSPETHCMCNWCRSEFSDEFVESIAECDGLQWHDARKCEWEVFTSLPNL